MRCDITGLRQIDWMLDVDLGVFCVLCLCWQQASFL